MYIKAILDYNICLAVENDQLTCFWCLTEDLLKNFISKIENVSKHFTYHFSSS